MIYDLNNLDLLFRIWIVAQKKMELVGAMDWTGENDPSDLHVITVNTTSQKLYRDPAGTPPGTFGDEFVLMQATDYLDINKRRIFVGDIVKTVNKPKWTHDPENPDTLPKVEASWLGVVAHVNGGYRIMQQHDTYTPTLNNIHVDTFEILGNIYQHPERNDINAE